jgi:hypothetical protein
MLGSQLKESEYFEMLPGVFGQIPWESAPQSYSCAVNRPVSVDPLLGLRVPGHGDLLHRPGAEILEGWLDVRARLQYPWLGARREGNSSNLTVLTRVSLAWRPAAEDFARSSLP